jgi:protein transport protein SEC20
MATFESLQERLAALQETTSQLRELIDRLANIKFQPGSVPLSSSDEDNVATELATEISQTLREEEEDLELLQEEIIDLRSGRPGSEAEHRKTRLKEGAHRLHTELKNCRTAFRRAQLSARRSLEAAQKLERDLLLASYAASATSAASSTILTNPDGNSSSDSTDGHAAKPPSFPQFATAEDARSQLFTARDRRRHGHNKKSTSAEGNKPEVVAASNDVTLALRRTHQLIAGELAKSTFAAQTLAESTAALAELERSYQGLDGLLARSRDLVASLVSAQKSDTWYLQMALRMLLATLAWLVFRRFLYGPLWWLVWFPLRTGWRVGKGVSSSVGGRQAATMQIVQPGGEGRSTIGVVGVGEEGAVPTVRVGGSERAEGVDPDSMVEKVGRMVEDTLNRRDEEEVNRTEVDDELGDQPNPKKRMWEEPVGPDAGAVRDEL